MSSEDHYPHVDAHHYPTPLPRSATTVPPNLPSQNVSDPNPASPKPTPSSQTTPRASLMQRTFGDLSWGPGNIFRTILNTVLFKAIFALDHVGASVRAAYAGVAALTLGSLETGVLYSVLSLLPYMLIKPGTEVVNSLKRQRNALDAFLKVFIGLEVSSDLLLETRMW
ncbi:hypothetical protein EDD85DRAFT_1004315 [Armillaria nabsnona]|nr:hypothetical protein EDD85DRAFT_1004315 [Armillaria nabsnona]